MKKIAQGAEAKIYSTDDKIIKDRFKKEYRIPEIDRRLRKSRTKRESKIFDKLEAINFPAPKLIETDKKERLFSRLGKTNLEERRKPFDKITMEYIKGPKVRDILEEKDYKQLSEEIGKKLAILHNNNLIHGDLTTSNMIYHEKGIYFIDFGLSYFSHKIEDKAVDLHLLKQALESKHYKIWETCFKHALEAYKKESQHAKEVLKRLETVEGRGRYKSKRK